MCMYTRIRYCILVLYTRVLLVVGTGMKTAAETKMGKKREGKKKHKNEEKAEKHIEVRRQDAELSALV